MSAVIHFRMRWRVDSSGVAGLCFIWNGRTARCSASPRGLSAISGIAPSDSHYKHPEDVVLDITDNATASYAVTPQPA